LIKTADLIAKQTEDFALHVIEACNESMRLTLHRHADTVDAFEQLEDPTEGWRCCGWVDLVRYRLVVVCQVRSESALRHGVAQQRQGHDPEQPFNPAGFFDKGSIR